MLNRTIKILGHILFSPVNIENAPHLAAATLAPIAILPIHQKQGLGTKLINQGLALLRQQNIDALFVTGHPEYYPRFGFNPMTDTKLKTTFDTPVDMYLELTPNCLSNIQGLVAYPKQWDIFT